MKTVFVASCYDLDYSTKPLMDFVAVSYDAAVAEIKRIQELDASDWDEDHALWVDPSKIEYPADMDGKVFVRIELRPKNPNVTYWTIVQEALIGASL